MKALLLAALLVALPACARKNDVASLQHEAVAVATFYAPKLDGLDQRVQAIFKRGTTIPANLPGIDAVGAKLTEARDLIIQLRGIVAPGADGKSAVEKQAQAAAKENRVEDLEKLIHDTHVTLERGLIVINDNLASVESWIAQFDRNALASVPAVDIPNQPTQPSSPAPPTSDIPEQGATPEQPMRQNPAAPSAPNAPAGARPTTPPPARPAPAPAPAPARAQPAPAQPAPARPGR